VISARNILFSLLRTEHHITQYDKSQYKFTSLAQKLEDRKFSYTLTVVVYKGES